MIGILEQVGTNPANGYTNNGLFQILDMSFESFASGTGASTEDINNIGAGTTLL